VSQSFDPGCGSFFGTKVFIVHKNLFSVKIRIMFPASVMRYTGASRPTWHFTFMGPLLDSNKVRTSGCDKISFRRV
jgi:hypothetical protein